MNTYKVVLYEATYSSYLVEANNEEEAEIYLKNGDLNSSDSYIADWEIVDIEPYVEHEA